MLATTAAVVVDGDGRVALWTPSAAGLLGHTADEMHGRALHSLFADGAPDGALQAGSHGRRYLRDRWGTLVAVQVETATLAAGPADGSFLLVSFTRPAAEPSGGGPPVSDHLYRRALRRVNLLRATTASMPVSSDINRTCESLVEALVPDFASWACVDLVAAVLEGEALPGLAGPWPTRQRLGAMASARPDMHVDKDRRNEVIARTPLNSRTRRLRAGKALLTPDMSQLVRGASEEAAFLRAIYPEKAESVIVAPLHAAEGLLGLLCLARTADDAPFDEDDLALVEEIVPKTALNISNAWRFAREHRTAVALQRSLLPRASTRSVAADTAGAYVSAGAGTGVSGDWYDAIPLSSFRCAFVVGDVVGHGLGATAMMGRLRTAVQCLADLDLDPEEVLSRLDDLSQRLSAEQSPDGAGGITGSTCLYAIYDPVDCRCVVASAGHPPPVLIPPGGAPPQLIEVNPGPPLGVGSMPFEVTELVLEPGTVLAFFTDGLAENPRRDLDEGMNLLRQTVARQVARPDADLETAARETVTSLLPLHPADDAALLLARVRRMPESGTASWELAAEASVVSEARRLVCGQLEEWGLAELAFTMETVVSELVTNAIRHAGGPIGLRLLRNAMLVCEVSDPSNSQPRLRRARTTDEGGRGLFIVAQLARRWGSRYQRSGKTIWVEMALPDGELAGVLGGAFKEEL